MSILHSKGWEVLNTHDNPADYLIDARYTPLPECCPNCGCVSKLYKHGTRPQRITDTPIHGKVAVINLTRVRYRCQECQKTFLQPLPDVAESGSMTKRLVEYIDAQSFRRTFTSIAEDTGVSEATVRNVFTDLVDYLDKSVQFETPEVLGIDEVHLLRHARCVLTNVRLGTMIELLEDRNKPTVTQRLFWMPDKERIRLVTMDMWKPYRDAVRSVLPDAKIVIDKFHVVRMATQALETVRRGLREGLNTGQRRHLMRSRFLLLWRRNVLTDDQRKQVEEWSRLMPTLGMAYKLKEDFYDIFDGTDRKQARESYERWKSSIPGEVAGAFKPVVTALTNWDNEVFNYFDDRVTNAVTEALNGIAKMANRMGRGYSFKVIRAKMLYAKSVQGNRPAYVKDKLVPKVVPKIEASEIEVFKRGELVHGTSLAGPLISGLAALLMAQLSVDGVPQPEAVIKLLHTEATKRAKPK